jgi:hypothetical protein
MGFIGFIMHAMAMLFVGALAFIIMDIASDTSPPGIVDSTTNDVRTGMSFLHRPLNENTFTYALLGLLALLLLYGLYKLYRRGDSPAGAA